MSLTPPSGKRGVWQVILQSLHTTEEVLRVHFLQLKQSTGKKCEGIYSIKGDMLYHQV